MKKIFLSICLAVIALSGCDLDRFPATSIAEGEAFKTLADATAYHNGFYSALRGRVYGVYCYSADVQADLWNASSDYGNRNGLVHSWAFTSDDYNIRDVWQGYYGAITQLNFFLGNVDRITVTAEEQATLDNYKGEAHLLRAYYYHQLAKYYCKAYRVEASVDNSGEMGLPLVTEYNVAFKPSRSSLADTYQQILGDITAAEGLLNKEGEKGAIYLTKDCVPALRARVYLSMGMWQEAATEADKLITSNKYPLVSTLDALKAVWYKHGTEESLVQLFAATTNSESASVNDAYLGYSSADGSYSPDYIPETWVLDLYADGDFRKSIYFEEKTTISLAGEKEGTLTLFNKFPGDSSLFTNPTVTNYQHMPKLFRIAEMHLIKAEALYRVGGQDGPALAALNVLREKRNIGTLSGLSGASLLTEIKNERTREMMGEGNRLDDLKRWNEGIDRLTGGWQNATYISPGTDHNQLQRSAGNDKFVWAIPDNDMKSNPGLAGQQNPGW